MGRDAPIREAALHYAERGIPIFPCKMRGKEPLTPNGFKDATTDSRVIEGWWDRFPGANIGMPVPEGVLVVDVDSDNALNSIRARDLDLPTTLTVETGRGVHLYYEWKDPAPAQSVGKLMKGVDTRAAGRGYVLVRPSVHPTGRAYAWKGGTEADLSELPEAPEWIRERLRLSAPGGQRSGLDTGQVLAGVEEGKRNNTLFRLACKLRRADVPEDVARGLVLDAASRCTPALPEQEAHRVVESAYLRYEPAPAAVDAPDAAGSLQRREWPQLDEAALHGPVGRFVRALEPHTESDPVAILIQALVAFGSVIGRQAHFEVEADQHFSNLFAVLVGETAKGRKGTSFGHILRLFSALDPAWAEERIQRGLSSGEGLIWAVRDEIIKVEPIKERGRVVGYQEVVVDHGIDDKRLLVVESEFASILKVLRREGSTLSPIVRSAWDKGDLQALTKNSPAKSTGAHISVVGHITRQELLRYLTSTEAGNGFGNRFLWLMVRRSKYLPEGGSFSDTDRKAVSKEFRKAIEFSSKLNRLRRDEPARTEWADIYEELSQDQPGLLGAMIARSEAQVLKVSCLCALLDCSRFIRIEHLRAALALWAYSEQSARFIFGDSLGDPVADELLAALRRRRQGMTRTEIMNFFGRHKRREEISRALGSLHGHGLVEMRIERTRGRPREVWTAVVAKEAK